MVFWVSSIKFNFWYIFFCLRPLLDYWQVVTLIARVFIGIAVGHVYYFLEDVFPEQQGGFKILKTPGIM